MKPSNQAPRHPQLNAAAHHSSLTPAHEAPAAGSARSGRPHLPYLDGWRGIAIICVLIGHFSRFGHMGDIGVTIFFVLSGILMSNILFVEQMPLRLFYRRRLARIVPVFWLYIATAFAAGYLALKQFSVEEFVSSALFMRTYFPNSDIFRAAIPIHHLWSLNVEEHSYLFLSLLSLPALRWGERPARLVLSVSSVLCLFAFAYYKYHPPASQSPFYLRTEAAAFPLISSCALFLWLRRLPVEVPKFVPVLTFLAAFAVAASSNSVFFGFVTVSLLLAISVNTLHVAPAAVLDMLSARTLRWFGVCSYSIYLWQQPFFFMRRYFSWEYSNLAGCLAALIVASASYYLFESPLRKRLGYGVLRERKSALSAMTQNASVKPPHALPEKIT